MRMDERILEYIKEEGDTTFHPMEKMLELHWMAMGCGTHPSGYLELPKVKLCEGVTGAYYIDDEGISILRLREDLRYSLNVECPEKGYEQYLSETKQLAELFSLLGEEEALNILLFMMTLKETELVRAGTVAKYLNITTEKVEQVLEKASSIGGKNGLVLSSGLLKEELSRMGSLIMEAARATQVPAGSALAVDREKFSAYITEKIKSHPLITVVETEVTELPTEGITVVAIGPLTSDTFAEWLKDNLVGEGLHFFDAVAPIVDASSINMDIAFFASRYNKGDADYINCPMTKEQYDAFYNALVTAEEAQLKDFDKDLKVFEGCMPVEVMAKRGYDTLRYGDRKSVV